MVANGKFPGSLQMEDMVFQGTVWGSVLWDAFFADAEGLILRFDLIATDVTIMRRAVSICSLDAYDLKSKEKEKL